MFSAWRRNSYGSSCRRDFPQYHSYCTHQDGSIIHCHCLGRLELGVSRSDAAHSRLAAQRTDLVARHAAGSVSPHDPMGQLVFRSPVLRGTKYELPHRIMWRNAAGGMASDKICPLRGETGMCGIRPRNPELQTPEAMTMDDASILVCAI